MNTVTLCGNLARDVEYKDLGDGKRYSSYTIAATNVVNNNGDVKEYTSFVRCQAWGKLADVMANGRQGDRAMTVGRIHTRSYERDGEKKYVTEVVAQYANFIAKDTSSNFDGFSGTSASHPDSELPF